MKTFNPQENLSEWIQNDWESDDYIEGASSRSQAKFQEKSNNEKMSVWLWILAAILYFIKSPMFWIAVLVIGLWKG